MANDESNTGDGRFPLTRLSVIEAVRSQDHQTRERALGALCEAYWRPIYKYIRLRWNRAPEDAEDLTQGFFREILERGLLNRFDAGRSRLRSYLRLCVDSFVGNEEKAATRQKRGGDVAHLSMDFSNAEEELRSGAIDAADIASPESLEEFFEKEWVRSLFAMAVEDLRALCVERKKDMAFRLFEAYDLEGDGNTSYGQLAQQYGVGVTNVTNWLAWARREFRKLALERLREFCGGEDEFRREARALFGWSQDETPFR